MNQNNIENNLYKIQSSIKQVCAKINRNSDTIKILPITKNRKITTILQLKKFGFTEIGENRVSEIEEKYPYVKNDFKICLVGKLQKNKVKTAINLVECIHSIDSIELAKIIDNELSKKNKKLSAFIEINLSKEKSKSGIFEDEISAFLQEAEKLHFLNICGFATMPPQTNNPENSRPYFKKLRELLNIYQNKKFENIKLTHLSMGTSQDYTVAIEEGATTIRIGRALFD